MQNAMKIIGLMSGTSVDGIDAALVEITGPADAPQIALQRGQTYPYDPALRSQILEVCAGQPLAMGEWAALDDAIALAFAEATNHLRGNDPIDLIGSHGQTVFHRPPQGSHLGYSVQLGRGDLIARHTRIPTICNFRHQDIALGGQGAPLVPKIDAVLLGDQHHHRCVQNIGGIGNVTYLPPQSDPQWQEKVLGWDTGPGNVLIDLAIADLTQGAQTYDHNGQMANQGDPCPALIQQWLNHPFFHLPPPKSTGRETFGPEFLKQAQHQAQAYDLSPADWIATLTDFTAASIIHSYRQFLPQPPQEILLCGGGCRNPYLRQRLQHRGGPTCRVLTTDDQGLSADFKEAIAFALLAYWHEQSFPGNLPAVTGAQKNQILGQRYNVISIPSSQLHNQWPDSRLR